MIESATHRTAELPRHILLILLFIAFSGVGCSSTKLVSTWRDPRFSGPIKFNKILALAINPDPLTRRVAEDAMVNQIAPGRAVPAYQVLSDADRASANLTMSRAKALGFDGLITMRLLGNRVRATLEPGSAAFYNYYDGGMTVVGYPDAVETERITSIETRIYSVSDQALIWSGVSNTVDLSTIKKAVGEIAKVVRSQLRDEGLLP